MYYNGISFNSVIIIMLCSTAVLLYAHFMHARKRKVVVPTIFFWRQVSGGIIYNHLKGKFRRFYSFLFLLFILVLICVSLLRPVFSGDMDRKYVFLIDCRDSMGESCGDGSESRLSISKRWCVNLLDDIGSIANIIVISCGEKVEIYKSDNVSEFRDLINSVNNLEVDSGNTGKSFEYGLMTAYSLLKHDASKAVIFSDHNVSVSGVDNILDKVIYVNPSLGTFNTAILDVQRLDNNPNFNISLTAVCIGPGKDEIPIIFSCTADEQLIDKYQASMKPGEIKTVYLKVNDLPDNLKWNIDSADVFSFDNEFVQSGPKSVFLSDEFPASLKCYFEASKEFSICDIQDASDIACFSQYINDDLDHQIVVLPTLDSQIYSRVVVSDLLMKYGINCNNDLFIRCNSGFKHDSSLTPYLYNEDGSLLAAADKTEQETVLYLADTLFDESSTFWKSPHFPYILNVILNDSFDIRMPEYKVSEYSNISDEVNIKIVKNLNKEDIAGRYICCDSFLMLISIIVLLMILDTIMYKKGIIT